MLEVSFKFQSINKALRKCCSRLIIQVYNWSILLIFLAAHRVQHFSAATSLDYSWFLSLPVRSDYPPSGILNGISVSLLEFIFLVHDQVLQMFSTNIFVSMKIKIIVNPILSLFARLLISVWENYALFSNSCSKWFNFFFL